VDAGSANRTTALKGSAEAVVQRRTRLTPREIECLRWCSRGKTNWEISRILGLSERTVEHYLSRANRKLGTANRTQAVAYAHKENLI
jgi:DNA-binding CsgD family transcriptional regulator